MWSRSGIDVDELGTDNISTTKMDQNLAISIFG
jgi:hypothetical protein